MSEVPMQIDRSICEKPPGFEEYVKMLEGIAALLKAAKKRLAKSGERYGVVETLNKLYIAYEGPAELHARVDHVERDGKKYAMIEVKYGEKMARVELDIEKYRRPALFVNLAAIATDDDRKLYKDYVLHTSIIYDYSQIAERLAAWAIFMPAEYKIAIDYYDIKDCAGFYYRTIDESPVISIWLDRIPTWARLGIEYKDVVSIWSYISYWIIERKSPIHHLVLKLARKLLGRGRWLRTHYGEYDILTAAWLMIAAILNTPDGKMPSEGLAVLVKKGLLPGVVLDELKSIFKELDKLLGPISRVDKMQLAGKINDYNWLSSAKVAKEMTIELGGVKINMAGVVEAVTKLFSEEGYIETICSSSAQ